MKITIASGKGGTGKTTLSTNLACLLAEKQEVVLVCTETSKIHVPLGDKLPRT